MVKVRNKAQNKDVKDVILVSALLILDKFSDCSNIFHLKFDKLLSLLRLRCFWWETFEEEFERLSWNEKFESMETKNMTDFDRGSGFPMKNRCQRYIKNRCQRKPWPKKQFRRMYRRFQVSFWYFKVFWQILNCSSFLVMLVA